jgi:acetylcholinesterase
MDFTHSNFTFVAQNFNCSGDAASELACMRAVPADDIEAFLMSYQDSQIQPSISFNAVVDEIVVFSNYTQQVLDGKLSSKPSIFGTTDLDGNSFAPFPTNFTTTGINVTIAEELEDTLFLCGTVMDSAVRNQTGRTTYRFQYRGNFTDVSPEFWMGGYHSSELPMIFGTEGDFRGPATQFEVATSEKMQDLWLVFANDPQEGLSKNGWATYAEGFLAAFGGANELGLDETIQLVPVNEIDDGACSFGL